MCFCASYFHFTTYSQFILPFLIFRYSFLVIWPTLLFISPFRVPDFKMFEIKHMHTVLHDRVLAVVVLVAATARCNCCHPHSLNKHTHKTAAKTHVHTTAVGDSMPAPIIWMLAHYHSLMGQSKIKTFRIVPFFALNYWKNRHNRLLNFRRFNYQIVWYVIYVMHKYSLCCD